MDGYKRRRAQFTLNVRVRVRDRHLELARNYGRLGEAVEQSPYPRPVDPLAPALV